MGLRFRKSIKIAPGVKVNLNKKSAGISIGPRGAKLTTNTKGKTTATVGAPGTGLSYSTSVGGKKKKSSKVNTSHKKTNTPKKNEFESTKQWYQKTGWAIAFLIIFFPIGLFLMWKHTNWNKIIKIIITAIFIFAFIGANNGSSDTTETHIYDNAEVLNVMNGSGTDIIGETSLVIADSNEITDEELNDWYFNYVVMNDFNWCVILYSDSDNNEGVYATHGYLQEGVIFSIDDTDGTYIIEDSSNAITYYPTDDDALEIQVEGE